MRSHEHLVMVTAALIVMLFVTAPAGSQTTAVGPALASAIEDLVVANHILADQGVFDAYGHVSVRGPGNPNRYLMSRPLAPSQVTAADIMEFDLDSNPVDQRGRDLLVERFLHGAIYGARPDVHAVVHSHSPAVIPFGVTSVPLRPVLHTASFLWPGVPIWDIRDTTPVSDLLVRNELLGTALAKALGDKPVVLMRGHGDVVVGKTTQNAVVRAIYTEVNARVLTTALGLGGSINYISAEEGAQRDRQPGDEMRAWNLWKDHATKK